MNPFKTCAGLLRHRLTGRPVPLAITMALTYRCNLRCRYCRIWHEAGRELSTRQILAAIDELEAAGMCRLGLTGGEPLLREDIDIIVDHARDAGLFTTLFTNGILAERHLGTLCKLDAVLLSLDGPRESHDAVRGKGAFAGVMRAIEVLTGEGVPVWTNTVLTRHNLEAVDFVLEQAQRFGTLAAFQPVFEHSYSVEGDAIERLRAEPGRYAEVVETLLERKRQGAPLLSSKRFLELVRQPDWQQDPRSCLAGVCYGALTPEGRVAPCPVLLQATDLPDGTAIGFYEAFRRSGRRIRCRGCRCISTIESDLLFSLDPFVLANTALVLAGERWRAARRRRLRRGASRPGRGPRCEPDICSSALAGCPEDVPREQPDRAGQGGTTGREPGPALCEASERKQGPDVQEMLR